MNITERKIYRFSFEIAKIDPKEGMRMTPYRFDIEAESMEDAKVVLLRDLQQVIEQIASTIPQEKIKVEGKDMKLK